jgi:hypothetical protein
MSIMVVVGRRSGGIGKLCLFLYSNGQFMYSKSLTLDILYFMTCRRVMSGLYLWAFMSQSGKFEHDWICYGFKPRLFS